MKIAAVTSGEEKDWYKDLDLLVGSIQALGATADVVIWDDGSIDWSSYDKVVLDSTWDYTEKYQEFLQWCTRVSQVTELVNPFNIIQLSSNKQYIRTLYTHGIHVPETYILTAKTKIDNLLIDRLHDGVVVKPLIGASGVNAMLFPNLRAALADSRWVKLWSNQDMLVQQYVPEIQTTGEVGAIFFGGQLSHCVLKKPSGQDFRVQYHYGGTVEPIVPPQGVEELYDRVIAALQVSPTYMRLDFIPTADPTVMEVEMVEPHKYFSLYPKGARMLASILVN